MKTSQVAMLVGGVAVAGLAAWLAFGGVDTGPDVADRALPDVDVPDAPQGSAPAPMGSKRPVAGTAQVAPGMAGSAGSAGAPPAHDRNLVPAPGDPLAELAYGPGNGDDPPDEVIRRTAIKAMDMHVERTRKQLESASKALASAHVNSKEPYNVLDSTMASIQEVQNQLADGALEPDDAFQQVNDLRRDAFESLPESESEAAKVIRDSLGFGDDGAWEGLGWGVPLDEESFGQLFEEP